MKLDAPIITSELTSNRINKENVKTFSQAIFEVYGIYINPEYDNKIHRFSTQNDGKNDGWYVVFNNSTFIYGEFGSWRDQEKKYTWNNKSNPTQEEISQIQKRQEEAHILRKLIKKEAAEKATSIYNREPIATSHSYMSRKQISNLGGLAKITSKGSICLPVYKYNTEGKKTLSGLQFINEEGKKNFLSGSDMTGGFAELGEGQYPTYICEGWATAVSIFMATDAHVIIAYNASNLPNIAQIFKEEDPIIIADNDKDSKTGERYAQKTGCPYILIPELGMDANDYAVAYGLDALKEVINPGQEQGEESNSQSFIIDCHSDLSQPKPVNWLIKDWLEVGGFTMIHGQPGSGKSFIALDMLLSISSGVGAWKKYPCKTGTVLYLCGEGFQGLPSRFKAWSQEMNGVDIGSVFRSQYAIPLNTNEGNFVIEQIEGMKEKPVLICIDTLNRFYSGDENSAEEIGKLIYFIDSLRQKFGSAVLLVHHTGTNKDSQDRARGSSALRGAVDTEISVQNVDKTIKIEQKKQKDAELLEPVFFNLKTIEIKGWFNEEGEPIKSAFPVLTGETEIFKKDDTFLEKNFIAMAYAYSSKIEFEDGTLYLSREEIRAYLFTLVGFTKDKVKNAMRETRKGSFINKLIEKNQIEPFILDEKEGYKILDQELVKACRIASLIKV